MDIQEQAGNIYPPPNKQPAVIHTEPDSLRAEAIQRLDHYAIQEEKLEFELARVRRMKYACQCMLNAFDEADQETSGEIRRKGKSIDGNY